jgi:hypothetical protein
VQSIEQSESLHVSEEDLELYLMQRLHPGRRDQVKTHLMICSSCQECLETASAFVERLSKLQQSDRILNRRSEIRFATRDKAVFAVLSHGELRREECLVLDVSKNGLQLGVSRYLAPGEQVLVRIKKVVAIAEVRHCKRAQNSFRAGLKLIDVFVDSFAQETPGTEG